MFGISIWVIFAFSVVMAIPSIVIAAVDLLNTFPKDNGTLPLVKPGTRTNVHTFK